MQIVKSYIEYENKSKEALKNSKTKTHFDCDVIILLSCSRLPIGQFLLLK